MVKRISLIVVCTAIAFFAFSFHSESKADKEENEEKEEEVDFQNIPLTSKQLNDIDLKLGEAQKREGLSFYDRRWNRLERRLGSLTPCAARCSLPCDGWLRCSG